MKLIIVQKYEEGAWGSGEDGGEVDRGEEKIKTGKRGFMKNCQNIHIYTYSYIFIIIIIHLHTCVIDVQNI